MIALHASLPSKDNMIPFFIGHDGSSADATQQSLQ